MKYYINAIDYDLDGYVRSSFPIGYDGSAANLEENYLTFDTIAKAQEWIENKGKYFDSNFKFEINSSWFFDEIIEDVKKIFKENTFSKKDDIEKAYSIALTHEWAENYTDDGLSFCDFENIVEKFI